MIRQPIFDAIRAARNNGFTQPEVESIDALLDKLGVGRDDQKRIGPKGLSLIMEAEGLKLVAYQDTGKVWTIGYGHTGPDVKPGLVITEAKAEELLRRDVMAAEADVRRLFPVTTPNQFDALVSFTFNLGGGQVVESTLRKLHNAGDYAGAQGQFARWIYDNGVKLNGLIKRRRAEAALYGSTAA